jgi:magnesium transporter
VIGVFEGSIEKLVALAALMPIVAGIGGNSGNQTITMIVRAVALGQVALANAKQLIRKEIAVSLVNGVIWGGGYSRRCLRRHLGADGRDDQPAAAP